MIQGGDTHNTAPDHNDVNLFRWCRRLAAREVVLLRMERDLLLEVVEIVGVLILKWKVNLVGVLVKHSVQVACYPPRDRDLKTLFDHARKELKARTHQSQRVVIREERFPIFASIGLFFLLMYWSFRERKRDNA